MTNVTLPSGDERLKGVGNPDALCNVVVDAHNEADLATILDLWHDFAEIPINDWDEIEKPFMHFSAGTYRFDIWHWFDERWPGGVYEMLFL